MFLILTVTMTFAGPVGNALAWLMDITGAEQATINWSVGGIASLVLAWVLKRFDWGAYETSFHRAGWFAGKWVSSKMKAIPVIGVIWDSIVEKFVIKVITSIPRLITGLFSGMVAGLLSDNPAPIKTR